MRLKETVENMYIRSWNMKLMFPPYLIFIRGIEMDV